jgi:hypothetical protein
MYSHMNVKGVRDFIGHKNKFSVLVFGWYRVWLPDFLLGKIFDEDKLKLGT